jgi:putative membrane protein
MFIDFIGVMLVNLAAGLALLAHYLYVDPAPGERRSWAAGFFAVGLLGLITAVAMITTWPLPGSYNVAFGEPAAFLSTAFLAAAVTLTFEWEPLIPSMYGLFGGILAIVVGLRLMGLHMTQEPAIAGLGYISAGLGGILTLPALQWRKVRWLAIVTAVILGISAVVWLFTGYEAVWGHIADFSKWVPATMLQHAAAAKK